jgi:hypothetical protein
MSEKLDQIDQANEFAAAKMYYGKGAAYAKSLGLDKMVVDAGKKAYSAVKTELRAQEIKKNFKKFGL